MKFYLAQVLSAAALFALAGSSNAALLFADSFTYPNGDLTSTADWEAHSGAASTPVQVVDGHAALVQGAGSREDVNAGLSSALVANQTLYMGFDLTTASGANQTYFAHFARDNGVSLTDFHTRIFTTGPTVGGNYTLGLRSATDSSPIKLPVDLTFGETYRVVASYEFNTGISKLWVNPTSPASTSVMETAATGIAFDHIALRQAGGNALQSIDNLVVATTFDEVLTFPTPIPEPHSVVIALMGACAVGAIGMRKRLG